MIVIDEKGEKEMTKFEKRVKRLEELTTQKCSRDNCDNKHPFASGSVCGRDDCGHK